MDKTTAAIKMFLFCSGRIDEAFSHCVAVWKTKVFKDSLEWVACCVEMFEVSQSPLDADEVYLLAHQANKDLAIKIMVEC